MAQIAALLFLFLLPRSGIAAEAYNGNCPPPANVPSPEGFNADIIKAAKAMPKNGSYDPSDARIDDLKSAINVRNGKISVDAGKIHDTFCSAATYAVFLKVVSEQQAKGQLELTPEAAEELKVSSKKDQPDGAGVWGRWNADGPGTATLFKELGLGQNFNKLSDAKAGDFVKLFWNDKIGKGESGHSVIFDSFRTCRTGRGPVDTVCYWSANSWNDVSEPEDHGDPKGGWALKCRPRSKVMRATVSRLSSLSNLNRAPEIMGKDSGHYLQPNLSTLDDRSMSPAELAQITDTSHALVATERQGASR